MVDIAIIYPCFCKTDYIKFSVSGLVKILKILENFIHTSDVQIRTENDSLEKFWKFLSISLGDK